MYIILNIKQTIPSCVCVCVIEICTYWIQRANRQVILEGLNTVFLLGNNSHYIGTRQAGGGQYYIFNNVYYCYLSLSDMSKCKFEECAMIG